MTISDSDRVYLSVRCPRCGAAPGATCVPRSGERTVWRIGYHGSRADRWWEELTEEQRQAELRRAADRMEALLFSPEPKGAS